MKRFAYNSGLALIVITIFLFAFKEDKPLTVTGTLQDWNFVLNVIDYSKIDPDQRIAARNFIYNQIINQQDSLTNKPKK